MGNFIDLTGKQFGKLTVIKRSEKKSQGRKKRIYWDCECECGNKVAICGEHLRSGHSKSCGCSHQDFSGEDLTGKKYGRLTVIRFVERKNGRYMWLCKCECGNECVVDAGAFKTGNTSSCGCFQKEILGKATLKHGKRRTSIYNVWTGMKRRCNCKTSKSYKDYGARGIKVCDEWENDFGKFYDWSMKNGYKKGLQIDRINTYGNYSPDNCRYISLKDNQNNRRNNVYLNIDGKRMTLAQYAEKNNYEYDRLRHLYVVCGLSLEQILENDYMNKPYKRSKYVYYEYNGEKHTLKEFSEIYNIDYVTLQSRVRGQKWDIKRAIEEPKHEYCINYRYRKNNK